jgi:hypothetical protein
MKKLIASVCLIASASVIGVASLACSHAMTGAAHADADTSTRRVSKTGKYDVSYRPAVAPIPKRELHAWTVDVRTADGRPVDGARIEIDGGMPDHGHGLPTKPAVSKALGDGRYVIDGMKFNMGGYWVVDLTIDSPEGKDDVRFELNL